MKSSEKNFGLLWSAISFLVGCQKMLNTNFLMAKILIAISLLLVLAAFFCPVLFKPFNFIWIQIGNYLQKITTPLILASLFFLIIFPIGLIRKFFVKNNFNLNYDSAVESYWDQDTINPESNMKTQF